MTQCYCLKHQLDTAAAPATAADILAFQGKPLQLDGSEVAFAGALGLQVLISARLQWEADGCEFTLSPISRELKDAASGLGVSLSAIGAEDTDSSGEATSQSTLKETAQ